VLADVAVDLVATNQLPFNLTSRPSSIFLVYQLLPVNGLADDVPYPVDMTGTVYQHSCV